MKYIIRDINGNIIYMVFDFDKAVNYFAANEQSHTLEQIEIETKYGRLYLWLVYMAID